MRRRDGLLSIGRSFLASIISVIIAVSSISVRNVSRQLRSAVPTQRHMQTSKRNEKHFNIKTHWNKLSGYNNSCAVFEDFSTDHTWFEALCLLVPTSKWEQNLLLQGTINPKSRSSPWLHILCASISATPTSPSPRIWRRYYLELIPVSLNHSINSQNEISLLSKVHPLSPAPLHPPILIEQSSRAQILSFL